MLAAFCVCYLGAHVLAAAGGWPFAATALALLASALVVSAALAAGHTGGRR